MIDLRRAVDPRIHDTPAADNWEARALWESPERRVLDVVRTVYWLRDGGLSAPQAWIQVRPDAETEILAARGFDDGVGVRSFLAEADPPYLELDDAVTDAVIGLASAQAVREIAQAYAGASDPPMNWLSEEAMFDDFDLEFSGRDDSEVAKIRERFVPGDQLWRFRSPPGSWEDLHGRAGFVLVRRGRPIVHVVTLMN